jgi:hypothetical protein
MGTKGDRQNPLTPALRKLMEACLILKTTDAKTLAAYLHRSPATIRTEFQRILAIMNVHCRYGALKTAEDEGWLYAQNANVPCSQRDVDTGAVRKPSLKTEGDGGEEG